MIELFEQKEITTTYAKQFFERSNLTRMGDYLFMTMMGTAVGGKMSSKPFKLKLVEGTDSVAIQEGRFNEAGQSYRTAEWARSLDVLAMNKETNVLQYILEKHGRVKSRPLTRPVQTKPPLGPFSPAEHPLTPKESFKKTLETPRDPTSNWFSSLK